MSEDLNPAPPAAEPVEAAKPARRKAPARSPRKKADAVAPAEAQDVAAAAPAPVADAAELSAEPAKPKKKRAPRKPRLAEPEPAVEPVAAPEASGPEAGSAAAVVAELPPDPVVEPASLPEAVAAPLATEADAQVETADETAAGSDSPATDDDAPAGPRRKRKRRRGRGERGNGERHGADDDAGEPPGPGDVPEAESAVAELTDAVAPAAGEVPASAEVVDARPLPPLTVVSLGLAVPPVLSTEALDALRGARVILGTAEALDRLEGLGLAAPQQMCAADSAHVDVRSVGHAGSVLVVVGDGAGDGPAPELLAELGPAHVRVLPGVGRVQAACAALGLSAEIVSLVDLRRAPLATLRGQLRAHRLLAVPLADADLSHAVARLLIDSGFAGARVWVCEFIGETLQAKAWLASELAGLRDPVDARAVLIIATGPSAGRFNELPGLSDAALGDGAPAALPLAARTLALAWLQPAAWETGWAIADGEASLALEWARAVPTARVRAVGIEPAILGVAMAGAGVGDNLAAIPSASPQRCREWPMPEAVFIRGGVGLTDWLAAAWARLAPGGRLVATAEDDQARADLLAFSGEVPAEAWQELSLSRGETVAGRLRFTPGAPVRLALWRKPALS